MSASGEWPRKGGTWDRLPMPEQRRFPRADRVHDGTDVVHPLLQGGHWSNPVGESRSALVEHDQARERRKASEEVGRAGLLPDVLNVRDEAWHHNQVDWPRAHDLIRDVNVSGPCV